MSDKTTSMFKNVIQGVLIAACSGSMGYGFSQSTLGKEVAVNRATIIAMRSDFSDEKARTSEGINRLIVAFDKQAEQNTEVIRLARELISLIKIQNQVKNP